MDNTQEPNKEVKTFKPNWLQWVFFGLAIVWVLYLVYVEFFRDDVQEKMRKVREAKAIKKYLQDLEQNQTNVSEN